MAERDNQQLGQYRLIQLLGGSEVAETYLGEHLFFKTLAVIKIAKVTMSEHDVSVFLHKMSTIAGLIHPNIVRTLDFGVQDSVLFLVMEYVPGGVLLRKSSASGSLLYPAAVTSLIAQIANALQYTHDQNIIHGDVKPENILVGPGNEALLSDFGWATTLQTTSLLQTQPSINNRYKAPEQMAGDLQPASDQYALAVIAYEWLNGKLPQRNEDGRSSDYAETPLSLDTREISLEVSKVLSTAMEREPVRRFNSVRAFAQALNQVCVGKDLLTLPAENQFELAVATPGFLFERPMQGEISQREVTTASRERDLYTGQRDINRATETYAVPGGPISQQTEQESRKEREVPGGRTSRRAVLISIGCSAVAVGGIATLIASGKVPALFARGTSSTTSALVSNGRQRATPTPTSPPQPTVTSQVPRGTTLTTYTGQSSDVTGVCWSPGADSRKVASCSQDGSAAIWDALSGTAALTFPQSEALNTLVWSPNGQYIAAGGASNVVTIWDATGGSVLVTCSGHTQPVLGLAWSPDSQSIVSTSQDYSAIVWDVMTGNKLATFAGHSNYVWSVAWSPDGSAIATGSWDNTVQIWNPDNGSLILRYLTAAPVRAVDWSPDSSLIASGGDDEIVQVWSAKNGTVLATYSGHSDHIEAVQWSPDGQYIASASKDTTVQIWQSANAGEIYTYQGHSELIWSLSWSPDGQLIVSGSKDRTAKVWQAV